MKKVLVLKPRYKAIGYTFIDSPRGGAGVSGRIDVTGTHDNSSSAVLDILYQIHAIACSGEQPHMPDVIAIPVTYGGEIFTKPAYVTPEVLKSLEKLLPQAPLHIPILLSTLTACKQVFTDVPVILIFETSFFTALPKRECMYALGLETTEAMSLRRFGYHGIYHEAAYHYVSGTCADRRSRKKVVSICVEPQPEVSSIVDGKPLTTTSGATPLEGIPGETTCGEIDPGIVIAMSRQLNWGPEQINKILTRESGLYGLAGERITVDRVFMENRSELKLARDIISYRILLACGSGMAAMGEIDAIVFSGRYAKIGNHLGPWLVEKLTFRSLTSTNSIATYIFEEPLEQIVADAAAAQLLLTK